MKDIDKSFLKLELTEIAGGLRPVSNMLDILEKRFDQTDAEIAKKDEQLRVLAKLGLTSNYMQFTSCWWCKHCEGKGATHLVKFEHEPDCPVTLAQQILKEQS